MEVMVRGWTSGSWNGGLDYYGYLDSDKGLDNGCGVWAPGWTSGTSMKVWDTDKGLGYRTEGVGPLDHKHGIELWDRGRSRASWIGSLDYYGCLFLNKGLGIGLEVCAPAGRSGTWM